MLLDKSIIQAYDYIVFGTLCKLMIITLIAFLVFLNLSETFNPFRLHYSFSFKIKLTIIFILVMLVSLIITLEVQIVINLSSRGA